VISLDTALTAARQTLTVVNERAERQGYYNGARTDIINSHADLRAALDMLIKAAERNDPPTGSPDARDSSPGQ
jgi:hypothetical protein